MKRKIEIKRICALMLCISLCGCAGSKDKNNTKETENTTIKETESETETETLVEENKRVMTYCDAAYYWHYMEINENAKPMSYDLSKFVKEDGFMTYEDDKYTYKTGIDVSKYQDKIKWNKVNAMDIDFAYIRLGYRGYTEGDMFLDEKYEYNIKNASRSGLDVGVYFFSQAIDEEEAVEEAEFVLENIKDYQVEMPIVYDPETVSSSDARTKDVIKEQYTKNCVAFCEAIKEAGYEPMIYCNLIWEDKKLDMEKLKDYQIWYADYAGLPQTPYDFTMWQYTENGKIDGISGGVDVDLWIVEK